MSITLETTGLRELILRIQRTNARMPSEARAVNRQFVPITRAKLIEKSSGRPGPEVGTGAYNAAYEVEVGFDEMSVLADNPSPQSDRLEYGFVGVDSKGRHYHQPPYPHFRPALEELAPMYRTAISEIFPRLWGSR